MEEFLLLFLLCLFFKSSLGSIGETVHSQIDSTKKRGIKFRLKRNAQTHYLYQPMRIHPYYTDQISLELSKTEQQRLKNVVDIAVSKVTQLLSVIPVSGPLLLSRIKACQTKWVDGPNVGRCSRIKSSYDGESCFNNIDNFKIPAEHLEEFIEYSNVAANQSKIIIPKGKGAQNADFILYIRSSFSFTCQPLKVIAYAKYCQQDQHGRPISGYVNFCSAHLKDDLYDHSKAILTIIHELLHALGFSKDLFSSFEECSDFAKCSKRSKIIRYDESSQMYRLVLPSVVREMQSHFNCSREDFGAPLETKDGEPTSHWDPKILYGSIMAPTLGRSHQTIIDRFTLAALEDSGWYQINYDAAEPYLWGRNEGCQFGLQQSCVNSPSDYFCQGNTSGCHHLHLDKAICSEESPLKPCRVMRSEDQDQCTRMTTMNVFLKPGEVYGISSRCFLSNISSHELTGFCFKHRCLPYNILQIQVKPDPWLNCSFGTSIQIPGFDGIVQCPEAGILCSLPEKSFPTTLTPPNISKIVTPPIHFTHIEEEEDDVTDDQFRAHLTICFPELHYTELIEQHQIEAFEWQLIRLISNVTGVSESRIINVKIKADSVINLEMLPPESTADGPTVFDATSKLINAVHTGVFSVRFNGTLRTASNLRILNEEPQTYPESWSEIQIAVIILGLIALIVLAFTIIIIIIRKKCHRAVQTVDQPGMLN